MKQALRSMAQNVFRTPPTDLLLTKGGGGLEWNLPSGGPLFIRGINLMVPSSITAYCLTYIRHILTSLSTFLKRVTSHKLMSVLSPQSLAASPITMTFIPIDRRHVTCPYSLSYRHLPSHIPNDPLAIYYWITYPLSS
jgi:hypothetical protein